MNTTQTDGPEYTKGEWSIRNPEQLGFKAMIGKDSNDIRECRITADVRGPHKDYGCPSLESEGNARLIVASVNAFISAGEKLGINPVILAERLEKGRIAELDRVLFNLVEGGNLDCGAYWKVDKDDIGDARTALSLVRGTQDNSLDR